MLPHRVDLADRGAGSEQCARQRALVFERDALRGRDPIGRRAAGQQHKHEIVLGGAVGERQRALGRGDPGFIRHRMAGFDHFDRREGPAIAVARDRDPGDPLGELSSRELRSAASAMLPAALPAATRRCAPRAGGRRQRRRQASRGCAAATAASKMPSKQFARSDSTHRHGCGRHRRARPRNENAKQDQQAAKCLNGGNLLSQHQPAERSGRDGLEKDDKRGEKVAGSEPSANARRPCPPTWTTSASATSAARLSTDRGMSC